MASLPRILVLQLHPVEVVPLSEYLWKKEAMEEEESSRHSDVLYKEEVPDRFPGSEASQLTVPNPNTDSMTAVAPLVVFKIQIPRTLGGP